jgi:hypothetical protein
MLHSWKKHGTSNIDWELSVFAELKILLHYYKNSMIVFKNNT